MSQKLRDRVVEYLEFEFEYPLYDYLSVEYYSIAKYVQESIGFVHQRLEDGENEDDLLDEYFSLADPKTFNRFELGLRSYEELEVGGFFEEFDTSVHNIESLFCTALKEDALSFSGNGAFMPGLTSSYGVMLEDLKVLYCHARQGEYLTTEFGAISWRNFEDSSIAHVDSVDYVWQTTIDGLDDVVLDCGSEVSWGIDWEVPDEIKSTRIRFENGNPIREEHTIKKEDLLGSDKCECTSDNCLEIIERKRGVVDRIYEIMSDDYDDIVFLKQTKDFERSVLEDNIRSEIANFQKIVRDDIDSIIDRWRGNLINDPGDEVLFVPGVDKIEARHTEDVYSDSADVLKKMKKKYFDLLYEMAPVDDFLEAMIEEGVDPMSLDAWEYYDRLVRYEFDDVVDTWVKNFILRDIMYPVYPPYEKYQIGLELKFLHQIFYKLKGAYSLSDCKDINDYLRYWSFCNRFELDDLDAVESEIASFDGTYNPLALDEDVQIILKEYQLNGLELRDISLGDYALNNGSKVLDLRDIDRFMNALDAKGSSGKGSHEGREIDLGDTTYTYTVPRSTVVSNGYHASFLLSNLRKLPDGGIREVNEIFFEKLKLAFREIGLELVPKT